MTSKKTCKHGNRLVQKNHAQICKPKRQDASIALVSVVERRILLIRGQRVLVDSDLAELYGVPTKHLNQQVRRNLARFPADFMFQLTAAESAALRSQIVTSNDARGGRRYRPLVFTEQGVAMLSSVLHSGRAVQVNVAIMRAFVRLRRMLLEHRDLAEKVNALERKYDGQFQEVFDAIRSLMRPPERRRRPIGFVPPLARSATA